MKKATSKMPKVILLVLVIFAFSSIHTLVKYIDDPLTREVEEVRVEIQAENWQAAKREAEKLNAIYEQKRWMMELFGPFEHVSDVKKDLVVLTQAIQLEDKNDALQSLAGIKARLQEFVVI
ncbi:DUF4363 family protein [Bacillus lacus]|uniref:DUF4363 family protein n=1 Tax=Metabacillus lacus TaxID=1983721 RepID=A0A7X2LXP8_9BACI|nr:DUF4363 family protein [Metabacillus lacus]MRX72785.1 DUF4363 family protein [Metabacillus lacus]